MKSVFHNPTPEPLPLDFLPFTQHLEQSWPAFCFSLCVILNENCQNCMLLVNNPSFQSLPPSLRSKATVRFFIYPQNSAQPLTLELQRGLKSEAILKVTDQRGQIFLQKSAAQAQHTLRNLPAGNYFFEINDGFYCQIKELEVTG